MKCLKGIKYCYLKTLCFKNNPKEKKKIAKVLTLSHVQLSVAPWTFPCQAYLSMVFSREGYWSALPIPSPGNIPNPGTKRESLTVQADSLSSEPPGNPNHC